MAATLTLQSIDVRAVNLPLRRPVIAKVGQFTEWPLILIDLYTEEGVSAEATSSRTLKTMRYLVPGACTISARCSKGKPVAPFELYGRPQVAAFRRLSGHVDDRRVGPRHGGVGCARQGGRNAALRAARRLGRLGAGLQQQRTMAEGAAKAVAAEAIELRDEGGFTASSCASAASGSRTISRRSERSATAVGKDIELMVDFNQGLTLGEALQRCHVIDDLGLAWIEEPIVYDNFDGYAQLAARA